MSTPTLSVLGEGRVRLPRGNKRNNPYLNRTERTSPKPKSETPQAETLITHSPVYTALYNDAPYANRTEWNEMELLFKLTPSPSPHSERAG